VPSAYGWRCAPAQAAQAGVPPGQRIKNCCNAGIASANSRLSPPQACANIARGRGMALTARVEPPAPHGRRPGPCSASSSRAINKQRRGGRAGNCPPPPPLPPTDGERKVGWSLPVFCDRRCRRRGQWPYRDDGAPSPHSWASSAASAKAPRVAFALRPGFLRCEPARRALTRGRESGGLARHGSRPYNLYELRMGSCPPRAVLTAFAAGPVRQSSSNNRRRDGQRGRSRRGRAPATWALRRPDSFPRGPPVAVRHQRPRPSS